MIKRHIFTLIIVVGIVFGIVLPQQSYGVSEAGVIFLLIEPGSRPGAMGNAYVAQVDDALAGYWNPGAMAFNRKTQFVGMHTSWLGDVFDDIYIEHLAWNQYFDDIGNIGAHVAFLTYGKQERTDEQGEDLGEFSSYELAVATSYANQLSDNIGLGLTFKFILSDLAPEGTGQTEVGVKGRGISYAFDFGFKYRDLLIRGLDYGINLQNLGPNIVYIDDAQSDPLPMNWRMGFSYRALESQFNNLTINADMNKLLANDDPFYQRVVTAWFDDSFEDELESTIFSVGAEYTYFNLLSLRGGYIYDKAGDIIGPSFGAGVQYTFGHKYKLSFDFAMQQGGGLVDYNKTFSLGLEF